MPIPAVISAVYRTLTLRHPAITPIVPTAIPTAMRANTTGPNPGLRSHWWAEIHAISAATAADHPSAKRSRRGPSTSGEGEADDGDDDRHHDDERHREVGAVTQPVVEVDATPRLEDHGDPEDRQREEDEREERDEVVEAGVLPQGRHDADGDADEDRHDRGGADELERHRDAHLELVPHRLLGHRDEPEVALEQQAAQPVEVALDRRLIEAQRLDDDVAARRRAAWGW